MNNLSERGIKVLASLGLILTTMIWGFAFVVMKNSVDVIPPTYLLAVRFSMSAVLLALLFYKNMMKADRETILCGVILGIFLCLSYQFQTYGLKYTTASKNAFITTLYVIIVPFLYWIVSKKRPTGRNITAAFLAVVGLALLSLQGDLSINYGDFLTLICGLMFAVHMVLIDKFTEHNDPIALTVIQILAAAIFNWICAPFLDGSFDFTVLMDKSLIGGLLYLAVFSTTVAYLLQNIYIGDPSFHGVGVRNSVLRDLFKGCTDREDVGRMCADVCGSSFIGTPAEEKIAASQTDKNTV